MHDVRSIVRINTAIVTRGVESIDPTSTTGAVKDYSREILQGVE